MRAAVMLELERLSSEYKFSTDALSELRKVYGYDLENVVRSLKQPSRRYFIRVNTFKTTVEEVQRRFEEQGWRTQRDSVIDEALFFEVDGPTELPRFEKHVIVDKFTAESVLQNANVYAPGIKKCSGIHRGDDVSILDDQEQVVGSGRARMSENEILTFRRGLAVELLHSAYRLPKMAETKEYSEGLFYSQSLPAMLTTKILDPRPGDTVVDLNCSPGGKLSHVFQITEGKANLIGFDRNKRKISLAKSNLGRLGFEANLIIHDSRFLDVDFPSLKADKCLVDPPCSALGVKPKTYENATTEEIHALSQYQRQFLKVASRVLRDGGTVVYSVCTMTLQECEEIVEFAAEQCDLQPEEQGIFIGSRGLNVVATSDLLQRFHPHIHDFGYFIALLRKRS
ncbi:MAG: PUA domain-containing protein [archaeon]